MDFPLSKKKHRIFAPTLTLNPYHPHNMLQSGRSVSSGGYRYGFNGMEQTKGVQGDGVGTFYDYKNRDYDPLSIRFKRTDPLSEKYPFYSPYQFAGNKPINSIDLDGLEEWIQIKKYSDSNNIPKISYFFDERIAKSGYGLSWVVHQYDGFIRTELSDDVAIPMNAVDLSSVPKFSEGDDYTIRTQYAAPIQPIKNPNGNREDLLDEFAFGFGPTNSLFLSNHSMTKSLQDSPEVNRLRELIRKKYNGSIPPNGSYTFFAGNFGLTGLVTAGTDLAEQFVGSFTGDVFADKEAKTLTFVISDAKSARSFLYRLSSSWERNTSTSDYMGMGNTYQKYVWTEPINNNKQCETAEDCK